MQLRIYMYYDIPCNKVKAFLLRTTRYVDCTFEVACNFASLNSVVSCIMYIHKFRLLYRWAQLHSGTLSRKNFVLEYLRIILHSKIDSGV